MKPWLKNLETEAARRNARDPRVDWGGLAILIDENGRNIPVIVENVSVHGFLVQSDVRLKVGQEFELVVQKNDNLKVKMVWTNGRFSGGRVL